MCEGRILLFRDPLRGCPTRTPAVASVGVLYPFQIITVSTIGELTEWLACQEIRPERGGVQITSLLSERQQQTAHKGHSSFLHREGGTEVELRRSPGGLEQVARTQDGHFYLTAG